MYNFKYFFPSWDGVTGHNSPLFSRFGQPDKEKDWNINASMHIWMGKIKSLHQI